MSLSNLRRPRIPSAFMPPDWSPTTLPPESPSSPDPPAEIIEAKPPPSPSDPRSPSTSVRSTVAPPSDVFSSPPSIPHEFQAGITSARSIRTNLRELKQRQAEIRRAKAAQSLEASIAPLEPPTPPTEPLTSPFSSVRSSVEPPSDVFKNPVASSPATQSGTASLRSVRNTLRGLKERQAARRKEHAQQRQATEEVSRILAEQHKVEMLRICKIEESTYEGRWERLWKRAYVKDGSGSARVMLRFGQVPWPLLTPIVSSPSEISTRGVERFLLSPFRKPHLTTREKIEEELKRWEGEDFEERVIGVVREMQRGDVRSGREKVVSALEELLQGLA